uniref:ABC transporter permease n=1 Tax=Anaerosporobacter sp. TaxID=1872529 RepID=UPI00286F53CF
DYIAVSIKEPISALVWFFIAVVMVIIGTYLLFIAGSVLVCRILQKKKNYYYKANHFVSVSSMVYRMKRNGAGLASICILATMVLVMISSTASLYFGAEDSLKKLYPKEINIQTKMKEVEDLNSENMEVIRDAVTEISELYGVKKEHVVDYYSASVAGYLEKNVAETDSTKVNQFSLNTFENVVQFYIIPIADYNQLMNASETLEKDEILLYTYRTNYTEDTLTIKGGNTFKVKKHIDTFIDNGEAALNVVPSIYVFVSDFDTALEGIRELEDHRGNRMLSLKWNYEFDTQIDSEKQVELSEKLGETFREFSIADSHGIYSYICDSREEQREGFYSLYGSLFFLGILLSVVFIFAAVLIIYYKQISEGYEDQARFDIMQKVGMTKKEIRKSINSQLLMVFFMPLIGAGMHLAFAFPIIRKLLLLFNLNNVTLFAVVTLISFVVFALFYTLVYRATSNAYYNIVSGAKER